MTRDVRSSESCAHRYGSLGSPYEARSTNRGVTALNVLIFLAGCTAEAIALETGSEIALAAQQVFGVATALIGVGTLFALTPLGSRVFKDGKVQRLSALVATENATEVKNPLEDIDDSDDK